MKPALSDIVRGSAAYAVSGVLANAASIVASILIARSLGSTALGLYALSMTGIGIAVLLADCGLDSLVMRTFVPGSQPASFSFGRILQVRLFTASIISLCGIVVAFLLPEYFGAVIVSALIVIPRSLAAAMDSLLKSRTQRKLSAVISSSASVFLIGTTLLALEARASIVILLAVVLVSDMLRTLALVITIRPWREHNGRITTRFAVSILRHSVPFAAIGIVSYLGSRMDLFLLGALRGPTEAGVFAGADRFLLIVNLATFAIFGASFPVFSMPRPADEHRLLFRSALKAGLILGVGIMLFFLAFSRELISLTFNVTGSSMILNILALSIVPQIFNTILGAALFAQYGERFVLKVLVVNAIGTLLLNVLLIPAFGAPASAWICVAAETTMTLVYWRTLFSSRLPSYLPGERLA